MYILNMILIQKRFLLNSNIVVKKQHINESLLLLFSKAYNSKCTVFNFQKFNLQDFL
jgi:hypothetical protein